MSKRVLVVEDDKELGSTMLEMLGLLGYEAELCTSKASATEKVGVDTAWDVIISDFSLGDGKGTDLMRDLLKIEALKKTKLIVASGYDKSDFDSDLEGLDSVEWIIKPYPIASLVALFD